MNEWIRDLILRGGQVAEMPSRYKDDDAFWLDGREIAHFEGDQVLDLRLTRSVISARRATLKSDPRVELRPGSDWVTVRVGRADAALLDELVQWAIDANRRSVRRR